MPKEIRENANIKYWNWLRIKFVLIEKTIKIKAARPITNNEKVAINKSIKTVDEASLNFCPLLLAR